MKKLLFFFAIALALSGALTYTQIANANDTQGYFFKVTLLNRLGYRAGVIEPLAEVIPAQLKLIGIDCESVFLETAAFTEGEYRNGGKSYDEGGMDMLTLAPGTSPPWIKSAGFWWSTDALIYAETNPSQFSNGRFDELLNTATSERDETKYKEQVREMQQILYDEAPWIPLYFPVSGIPMVKELEGFRIGADYSRFWTVDTKLAGKTEADDVTVIWGTPTFTPSFLPPLGKGSRLQAPMYDSMFIKGPAGFEQDLIESYEISEDGLTWIIKIPDNVKWHDGVPMTSKDIKFTWDLKMNKEFEGYESGYFQGWKPIEIVDDTTVKIVLEDYIFADLMKRSMEDLACQVVPEHIMKDVPIDEWSKHWMYTGIGGTPIGNGPFKFVKFVPDQYAEYEANDDYWRGRPFIDHLFIKILTDPQVALVELEKGDVQVIDGTYYGYGREMEEVDKNPDLKYEKELGANGFTIMINTNHPNLCNKYVRWAISYAMPREQMVEDISYGLGVPININCALNDPVFPDDLPLIPYDLDKAKEMMELAGYKYEYLEPPPELPAPDIWTPAIIGLVIGVIATAAYFLLIKKE